MRGWKVILYMIGAGGLIGVTYAFFWLLDMANDFLGDFDILLYQNQVWIMTGILAGMIVFSALAEGRARLELLSSASFLIYACFAYLIGCSIYTVFLPYNGFGSLDLELYANLSGFLGTTVIIDVALVYLNTLAAILILIGQGIKFLTTFFKSMKRFKEE